MQDNVPSFDQRELCPNESPTVPFVPPFQSAQVVVVLNPKASEPVHEYDDTACPFSSTPIGTWMVPSVRSLLLFATRAPVVSIQGPFEVRWSLALVTESESHATQAPGMPAAVAMSAHS